MLRKGLWFILSLVLVPASAAFNVQPAKAASGDAQWAKSTIVAADYSGFSRVAADASGNIYAAGYMYSNTEYNFGNGVTATGGFAGNANSVIVKYNSSGVAQWAKSVTPAPSYSIFNDVAVDAAGNAYAVGYIRGNGQFNFGNGVTVNGGLANNYNAVIVKYNSSGVTQWAKSTTATAWSYFDGVATDSLGNIFAVGRINTNAQFTFSGATVTGAYATDRNTIIVKYDSDGNASWAKSTTVATNWSYFNNVETDTAGNIYAVGRVNTNASFSFSAGATVTGAYAAGINALVVKYDSSGTAQWARSTTAATNATEYLGVATDTAGNIYTVGDNSDGGACGFGNSATVTGASADGNTLIVKYNIDGTAQWARSTTAATNYSWFNDVAADTLGNIYAAGIINNNGQFNFGNSVTVAGLYTGAYSPNAVLVKYNTSGIALDAKSVTAATNVSNYYGVVTALGNVYAVGDNYDNSTFGFGNGVTVAGASANGNIIVVKYEGTGPTFATLPGDTRAINIDEGQTITTNPYTIRVKPTAPGGIDKVEFYIDDVLIGTDTTADNSGVYSYDWDTATYHSTVKVIAYDLNGYTTTLTRSTTVSLIAVASLPETGPGKTLEIILYFIIIASIGIYSVKKSKQIRKPQWQN